MGFPTAVMRTTALEGEIHLDGRPSMVNIDLHQLGSDQRLRDRYVRGSMFPAIRQQFLRCRNWVYYRRA